MVFKLIQSAQKRWRRLRGFRLLADVIEGVNFKDGARVDNVANDAENSSMQPITG